jgi:hypothetical protein
MQAMKGVAGERGKTMAVIIHFSEAHMTSLLYVLNKRKWEFKLHTWVQNVSTYSKSFTSDAAFWVVCWRTFGGPL